tara:strand:- start:1978 stop:2304 length:327 start_codon:yes stop_codon:yes gene_type:complete
MDTLYLVQNDNGAQVKVTVTREDTGAVVNLSGSTVVLKFKRRNTPNLLSSIVAEVLSDFENGEAIFNFNASALDIASGDYVGEVEVTFNTGAIETVFEELEFVVREDY